MGLVGLWFLWLLILALFNVLGNLPDMHTLTRFGTAIAFLIVSCKGIEFFYYKLTGTIKDILIRLALVVAIISLIKSILLMVEPIMLKNIEGIILSLLDIFMRVVIILRFKKLHNQGEIRSKFMIGDKVIVDKHKGHIQQIKENGNFVVELDVPLEDEHGHKKFIISIPANERGGIKIVKDNTNTITKQNIEPQLPIEKQTPIKQQRKIVVNVPRNEVGRLDAIETTTEEPNESKEQKPLPLAKDGDIDYDAIEDAETFGRALKDDFDSTDEVIEVLENYRANLEKSKKATSRITDAARQKKARKAIDKRMAMFDEVKQRVLGNSI